MLTVVGRERDVNEGEKEKGERLSTRRGREEECELEKEGNGKLTKEGRDREESVNKGGKVGKYVN